VIDSSELDANVVRVGSQVHITDDKGKSLVYTIVGSTEADPAANRLSNESPVGKALVGRKKGEAVKVTLPSGKQRELTVTGIEVA
jgi:transcription elongation factor GreA